ncbi:MAG: DMT family transporter [Bacillota bacterium]
MSIPPYILLILAPLFWSVNFLVGKALAGVIPAGFITLMRWLITSIILIPIYRKDLLKNRELFTSGLSILIALGLSGYFFNSVSTFLAVQHTTAINASFLTALNPVAIVIASSLLFKERSTLIQLIGIVFSLFGVLWIVFKGHLTYIFSLQVNLGDAFMLVAVISWALYSNILKKKGSIFPWPALFAAMTISAVAVSLPYSILEVYWEGWEWILNLQGKHYLSILAIAIFPSLLAFYCWNTAMQKVDSSQAAVFINLIPVFTTILSIIFLGEKLMYHHIIGGLLIFLGVFMVTNHNVLSTKISKIITTGSIEPRG